jgi:general secretion pathway protein L
MASQLVVSINSAADHFRWCWLQDGRAESSAAGNLEALQAAIGQVSQQVWLLLPGAKVVTRELEYSEKEKKHLRSLLPYQLEESVVGDVEDLHFALGEAAAGKVVVAYTDRDWLRSVFAQLASIGAEITRCWSTPSVLPLAPAAPILQEEPQEPVLVEAEATPEAIPASVADIWVLALQDNTVNLRLNPQQAFSIPLNQLGFGLQLLMAQRHSEAESPRFSLRAADQEQLDGLLQALPATYRDAVISQTLADDWELEYQGKAIDLCQAEFSQRLPLERWWKLWRNVAILAAVTFAVYVGVSLFHIHKLKVQNLQLRQQMEATYRTVVPTGQSDDPEKRLRIKLAGLQPKNQTGGSVVSMLAGVLPLVAGNPDVSVKLISYSGDTGEMNINVQAGSFSSIDALRQSIASQGYSAELLTANANTGRLKISKPAQ